MLEQIDTAIGFAVVMLLLSLMITSAVQLTSTILDLRGRNLQNALGNLLKQIAPELRAQSKRHSGIFLARGTTLADEIAAAVSTHPAFTAGRRLKAIRLDELTKVLNDLASNESMHLGAISSDAKSALDSAMSVVSDAQNQVKTLEQKAAAWFDSVMDRTSDTFRLHSRVITIVASFVFVAALQIDALSIYQQISGSTEIRLKLTQMSESTSAIADRILTGTSNGRDEQQIKNNIGEIKTSLDETKLKITSVQDWEKFKADIMKPDHVGGIIAAGILLSLGAPFWFNALRQLSALKPIIANKIEKESTGG
jgi:uncharacterized protein (DUF1810 family)